MWANSKPHEYLSFRVFIFGITNQSMFPNGVVYDGVLDNKPLNFRGESGANDSMVRRPSFSSLAWPSTMILIIKDSPSGPSLPDPHAVYSTHQDPSRIPCLPAPSPP